MNDPDFPTGKWEGFIIEGDRRVRHPVTVTLDFEHRKVKGVGRVAGEIFALHGTVDRAARECRWVEQWDGYTVTAKGFRDAMKVSVWGVRESGRGKRSGFLIWPVGKGSLDGQAESMSENQSFEQRQRN
jgi:hypothetical protein